LLITLDLSVANMEKICVVRVWKDDKIGAEMEDKIEMDPT
jgi:hypothetical protein